MVPMAYVLLDGMTFFVRTPPNHSVDVLHPFFFAIYPQQIALNMLGGLNKQNDQHEQT